MSINNLFKLIFKSFAKKKQAANESSKTNSLHHYIPRFYLRSFGINERISVWEKQSDQIRMNQNPARVAASRGFYTFQNSDGMKSGGLEEMLANLEGRTQSAIRGIDRFEAEIPSESKEVLADFIAVQHVRTPKQRKIVENNADLLEKILAERTTPQKNHEFGTTPSKEVLLATAFGSAPAIYGVLMERPWFLVNFNTPCLVTSDNPIIKIPYPDALPNEGVGLKTCREIWFPLTARKLIIMKEVSTAQKGDNIHILNENDLKNYKSIIKTHNHHQIIGCYMEAYGLKQILEKYRIQGLKIHPGIIINYGLDAEIETGYNSSPENPRPRTR